MTKPIDLEQFFAKAVANGAALFDVRDVWKDGGTVGWLLLFREALSTGSDNRVQQLWNARPKAFDAWSAATNTAIQNTINDHKA